MKHTYEPISLKLQKICNNDSLLASSFVTPMKIENINGVTVESFESVQSAEGRDYFDITFE